MHNFDHLTPDSDSSPPKTFDQRTGDGKTRNLPIRENWFILYQIVIFDVLMSYLVECIR